MFQGLRRVAPALLAAVALAGASFVTGPGAIAAPAGPAGTSFSDPFHFTIGTVPWLVDAGDINSDGRPDIVTANAGSFSVGGRTFGGLKGVSVLLNRTASGSSAASFAPKSDFAAGVGTLAVDVADLDGDGLADVATANAGSAGPNGVSVLRNRTTPGASAASFDPAANFDAGIAPALIVASDVTGDGRLDLVTGNAGQVLRGVSVLVNQTSPGGALSFSAPHYFPGGLVAEGLAAGDLNADGRPDLVVGNTGSSTVTVLTNTTPAGSAVPSFGVENYVVAVATGVALGDVDGDGRLDLAAGQTTSGVTLLLNRTAAGATEPNLVAATHLNTRGFTTEGVAMADYDGNGKADVAATNDFNLPGWDVAVLTSHTAAGAAAPEFAGPDGYRSGWGVGTNSITTADFNQDGRPDLATGNVPSLTLFGVPLLGRGVSVLLNLGG